jgi:hypothetical protein
MHVAPALFPHARWRPGAPGHAADVPTPLGTLLPSALVDGHLLVVGAATLFDAGAARLWVWDGGVFRVELLRVQMRVAMRAPMRPPMPSGDGAADGAADAACEIVRWRLHATERPAECEVSCRWQETAPGLVDEEGADSARVVRRWRARGWSVQLQAPARDRAVHGLPDGVVASAPMERGARLEVQMAVAWWAERAAGEAAPRWPGADAPFEQLLG